MANAAIDGRAPSVVGRHARLELVFEYRSGRTVLAHAYTEPPFRITRSFDVDGAAYVILMSSAPGVFAGDCLRHRVTVGRGARALIHSQSALQVHPTDAPCAAEVHHDYHVDEDADLLCHWDPSIPFADARLVQRINVQLADSSRLYWSDGLMSGRVSRAETWKFQSIDHELRVRIGAALGYLERYRLMPETRHADRPWVAGSADFIGTTIVRHEAATPERLEAVQRRLDGAGVATAVDLVDPALNLLVGRFMGASGVAWQRARAACRDAVLELLFANPALRFRR
jgi:urease accessory protein UreH